MANNCFQIIRKMFNWSVEKDILTHTPCFGVKLPSPKVHRERLLSESEVKAMWCNLDQCAMTDEIRRALKLTLVTAQRPGEVIGLPPREIDGNWWTIPVPRQKVPKVKEAYRSPHRVYLTKTALELIGDTAGKELIFKSPVNKKNCAMTENAMSVAVQRNLAFPVTDAKGKSDANKEESAPV